MTEFNTNSFLIELDSFGKPPPQQKLVDRGNGIMAQSIAEKLNMINLNKQMVNVSDYKFMI
uniref:Uncharacterized protein n=1 Tax=Heterorhabditis bacteriophora TaxID=37862 RepID=A0A1I7X3M0_HETBA